MTKLLMLPSKVVWHSTLAFDSIYKAPLTLLHASPPPFVSCNTPTPWRSPAIFGGRRPCPAPACRRRCSSPWSSCPAHGASRPWRSPRHWLRTPSFLLPFLPPTPALAWGPYRRTPAASVMTPLLFPATPFPSPLRPPVSWWWRESCPSRWAACI